MKSNRDTIRAAMNASFANLPEWLRAPFVSLRETLTILFDQAKAGILAGIDSLISDTAANDPLRTPEALAMAALAVERRLQ